MASPKRNLIDHPAPGDRYEWRGHVIDVANAPITVETGHRVPIMILLDGSPEIWTRYPWLQMHKTARLLRTAEQFIEQIEAAGHPLSVIA